MTDDGYVHEPDRFDEDGESVESSESVVFGWRGWVLVSMMLVSFVLVPVVLAVLAADPGRAGTFGLGFRDAYMILPLVPGVFLGVVAVWAAVSR